MTSYDRDRHHGHGLPACVNVERLAQRWTTPRVRDRAEALRRGFEPVQGHRNLLRKAHTLWTVKKAEDGEGYVLLRLRDEPSPTVLARMAKHANVNWGLRYSAVALYRKAQMEHAIPGNIAAVARDFAPLLHGDRVELKEGDLYKVTGFFAPTEDNDLMNGVPRPIYPPREQDYPSYMRIRLRPESGGEPVFVFPEELDVQFDVRGTEEPKAQPRKPDFYERSIQKRRQRETRNERLPEGVGPDQGLTGEEDTADIRA